MPMYKPIATISLIKNKIDRNVTFCKRKKGLIKKAMELSVMCDQDVALFIFDKEKNKFIAYNSSKEFSLLKIGALNEDP